MRINVIEKFGLYERLTELSKGLIEHEESQNICKKAIHDLKSGFTTSKFNLYLEQLKQYEWITEIENFLESVETFLNENEYGLKLEGIMNKLSGINTYVPIVDSIKNMVVLQESEIKDQLSSLSKFKFEPNVKRLIESYEKAEFNTQKTTLASITHSPVSYLMHLDEGYVFSSKSGNYVVNSDITKVEKYNGKISAEFSTAQNALNLFTYKGNNTFEAVLPKASIKVVASDDGETTMTINESSIDNKEQLTRVLKNAGFINYTDTKTRSLVEFMYEKASEFVEVNFVKSIETINENFEVFKMTNNEISIAKFDKVTRGFVLESLDLEDVEELNESLKKSYDLDFDNVLEGLHINVESLEFKTLVENIEVSDIKDMTKSTDVITKINEAVAKYNDLDVINRANVENEFIELQAIQSLVESEEVTFILETKAALVDKLEEGEELEKSLVMLNEELSLLVEAEKLSNGYVTPTGKEIAKKMKDSKTDFPSDIIKKVEKMEEISQRQLDKMLPDYIAGKDILALFK